MRWMRLGALSLGGALVLVAASLGGPRTSPMRGVGVHMQRWVGARRHVPVADGERRVHG